jgi:methyl-accepting chemotaxis protein
MYKLTQYLENIRNGAEIKPLFFRDTDQFSEIAEDINSTISYLVDRSQEQKESIDEIKTYIENISLVVPEDKKPVLEEIQRKLTELK